MLSLNIFLRYPADRSRKFENNYYSCSQKGPIFISVDVLTVYLHFRLFLLIFTSQTDLLFILAFGYFVCRVSTKRFSLLTLWEHALFMLIHSHIILKLYVISILFKIRKLFKQIIILQFCRTKMVADITLLVLLGLETNYILLPQIIV